MIYKNYRFGLLLSALILLLLSVAIVRSLGPGTYPKLASFVVTFLFAIILLSAVLAVSKNRKTAMIAIALASPAILLQLLHLILAWDGIETAKYILVILFLSYVIFIILKHLFEIDRVTLDTICASLCVYLILGLLFSIVYSLIEILEPGSFAFSLSDNIEEGEMRFGGAQSIFALYYSFVTMTTLGYGDIVPASAAARMLAAIQALMGQLYLVVLVARLVGLHISHSHSKD